ncbi:pectate lyase family protein [Lachnospira pectinoschiza]|uniref:Pectate lyase n=1 Tax=Lachnospira pectinoschiza TaxID=28052 RepID=A0A1G9W3V0_9FIRM|nr:right-handed parallel beta-helix repeat-containing protein [Lachnospira pectinoschiza]SDM78876.1 Pectate lyase [Lachnospira pectinoschiza]
MMGAFKRTTRKRLASLLAVVMTLSIIITASIATAKASVSSVVFTDAAGYLESAYAEWTSVEGADGYVAYVKEATSDDSAYTKLDNELIREYTNYWRVDALGLAAGNYVIKVVPYVNGQEVSDKASTTDTLNVTAYDRSGFAFSSDSQYKTGSGAYNDDGTLKSDAIVLYIYDDTAKTVKATIQTGKNKYTEVTGLQAILTAYQKGYETRPLDVRIIGNIDADSVDSFGSSSEGIQIKGKNNYSQLNITIEGVGEDASVHGFGFLIRNAGNVEMRNFSILYFMDDGISIDTNNCNIWVHNMDLYYGNAGSDSDQAKGDGSVDIKGNSQYVTVSYVHFYDSGKCSLCGMKSESGPNYITYHHNWFDHSDSRMARIRTMSVHLYNNYYDGNSKYGVGVTTGSSAFVENNYFRGCAHPMLSSLQGTDALGDGTFSGENGGVIKAFNNYMENSGSVIYANTEDGNSTSYDAYLASSRDEVVSGSYKTLVGSTSYDNFDTTVDLGVDESNIDAAEDVKTIVTANAGSQGGGVIDYTFSEEDDSSYAVDTELLALVRNYKNTELVSVLGVKSGASSEETSTEAETETTKETETSKETTTETTAEETTTEETTTAEVAADTSVSYVQNFTADGMNSDFFTISGNLSTSKGTVTYNGLTLTQCLKMESATSITFTAAKDGKLTLVFGGNTDANGKKVKVNGTKYTIDSTNVLTVDVSAGSVSVAKGDSINLFYMVYSCGEEETSTEAETTTEAETSTESKDDAASTASTVSLANYDKTNTTYSGSYTDLSQATDSDFANAIYVSTSEELVAALENVAAGQAIIMADGTYKFDATILIPETNCGSEGNYKILRAADNANVVLDFSSMEEASANRGVVLDGDYWYVNGITFYGAGDNGMLLAGSNNIIEGCVFEANHDTGLQLSRYNTEYSEVSQWPSNNLILNCTSFDNCDLKTQENADGFAAKLTCGEGNVFDGCISYANSDDGWDLYAKTATGPIGVVTIRNCVAFANGKTTSGTSFGSGDMNGFKLGGSGVGTAHYVFNCLAFNNGATGFTDNNNPSNLTIMNCTAASNGGGDSSKANFMCYRSASGALYKNLVSYNNSGSDKFTGVISSSVVSYNKKNYIFETSLGVSVNNSSKLSSLASAAYTLSASSFKNANNNISVNQDIDSLFRNADGTINVNGLYETEATSDISSLGAHFNVASQKIALLSSSSTEPATEESTEASTEATEAPTQESTEAPTEESTEAPTEESTETPTQESTEAPTQESTEAPTETQEETSTEVAADTDTVYEMLEGDGVTVTGTEKLVLRSSASYDLFLGVMVDGVLVDPSNYVSYSGSTVVEFNADFMSSLTAGVHEFTILSKDGSASTNVTITGDVAAEVAADTDVVTANEEVVLADTNVKTTNNSADTTTTSSTGTGDTANVIPYIILLVIAGVAIATGVVVSIKKKHN